MRKKRNRVLRKQRILFSPFSFQRIRVQQFDALNYCSSIQKIVLQKRDREREKEISRQLRGTLIRNRERRRSIFPFFLPWDLFFLASSLKEREREHIYIKKLLREREREREFETFFDFSNTCSKGFEFQSRKINKSSFARESREISER